MRGLKKIAAVMAAGCMLLTGCGQTDNGHADEKIPSPSGSAMIENLSNKNDDPIEIYTGRKVKRESDLAIYKISGRPPKGYETLIDNSEGKLYASPNGSVTIKAQNFKEEFQDLETFADQGCATLKINNMFYQADTEFSEPQKTKVAGYNAIRYDYDVTAYIYLYETDAAGNQITDSDGNPVITDEKEVYGEYKGRIYFFYSNKDVFYIICEARKENADAAAKEFDEFISSIKVN